MPVAIDFRNTDFETLIKELQEIGPVTARVLVRAVRKVTRSASSQAARDVAQRSRVPARALTKGGSGGKGRRIYTRLPTAKPIRGDVDRDTSASIWLGHNPIPASRLGAMRQQRSGARAGRHTFYGAFLASMPSGYVSIFKRRGKRRLPIDEQAAPLEVAEAVMREIERTNRGRLRAVLLQEFNYELNVKR